MTSTDSRSTYEHVPFLAERDEISLAQSRDSQTPDSVPDDLRVRGDATALLGFSLTQLRRPVLIGAAALAIGVLTILVGGVLGRGRGKAGIAPSP